MQLCFSASNTSPSPADFKVRVNGIDLPANVLLDIQSIKVQEDLDALSMITLELSNWDQDRLRLAWSDDDRFKPGNDVEVSIGPIGQLNKVMVGEITSLEPAFQADSVPMLTVRAYDYRHRLLQGQKTRSFTKVKDSEIAKQIASEAGLKLRTERRKDGQETRHDYVLQHNQTDLHFLQDRAQRLAYELFIQEKTLYFRPPQPDRGPVATLSLETDIVTFLPRLTTMSQQTEVVVRGWNMKEKKAFQGRANIADRALLEASRISGPQAAKRAFGKRSAIALTSGAFSQAEALQIAQGQFNAMALTYITGEGTCYGRPELHAGQTVNIAGAGQTFSGRYYLASVEHTLSPEQGYLTNFTVQRSAA